MRNIPSEYMDLLTDVRRVSTRFTFRDERLIFEKFPTQETGLPTLADGVRFDSTSLSHDKGIFRVARNSSGYLCYQYISDPTTTPWPAWVETTHLLANCRPGVVDNNGHAQIIALMNFGGPDEFVRIVYSTTTLSLSTPLQLAPFIMDDQSPIEHQGVAIAPVSPTEAFVQFFPYSDSRDVNHAIIQYWAYIGGQIYSHEFEGAVYGDITHPFAFDAVQLGTSNYIFTSDNKYGRPLMFTMQQLHDLGTEQLGDWSDGSYILPLDILDETSFLKLGAASLINDQIWVTGRLKRGSDIEMEIYMYGDGHFSMGRDMYIGNSSEFTTDHSGKMVYSHERMWFLGWGNYAQAPATELVGHDNNDKRYTTSDIINMAVQQRKSSSLGLVAQLSSDADSEAIRRNSKVTVDVGLQDSNDVWEWAQLGVFGVDALSRDFFGAGDSRAMVGRGAGTKRLAQWTSDAFYDYWSQAKLAANPATLAEVIRVSGVWSTAEEEAFDDYDFDGSYPIRLDRLNDMGLLYTTAKSSRNGQMMGKFWVPETDPPNKMHGRFGVGINYYHESRGQAAERLGVESSEVADGDFGDNGIFCMIGPEEHNGDEGIALYAVKDSVWNKIYSETAPANYSKNAWAWMKMQFNEGYIRVDTAYTSLPFAHYGATLNVHWFKAFDLRFDTVCGNEYIEPWFRDQRGRGAIAIHNISSHSDTPGFTSTSTVIPVEDVNVFPTSDTVIVNSEIIDYDGKHSASMDPGELTLASGRTYPQAPHDNPDWTNVKLYHIDHEPDHQGEIDLGRYSDSCLGATQGIKGPFGLDRVDKIRVVMKRVGLSSAPVYAWIVSDDFDNAFNLISGIGRWDQPVIPMVSAPKPSQHIPVEYDWVEFDMTATPEPMRWLWPEYSRGYFIFITTVPPYLISESEGYGFYTDWSSYADSSNYYVIKLDNTVSSTTGVWLGWSTAGWRKFTDYPGNTTDTMMPFEIYGVGNTPSEGYEIYVSLPYVTSIPREYFDNMALVVTDGPGKGMALTITDSDHTAPDQWVPSRTYLPPDSMEDHINDPAHGDWVNQGLSRVFVARNVRGYLGEGSTFEIYPSLSIATRGAQDTVATAHGAGTVSIYSDLSVMCQEVRFASGEVDMRLEDMAEELCAKAGVLDFSAGKDYTGEWYHDAGENVEWMPGERRHGIVKFDHPGVMPTDAEIGIIARSDTLDIDSASRYYKLVYRKQTSTAAIELYILRSGESELFLIESHLIYDTIPQGTVTMSIQQGFFSVWINDKHIVTFHDDELETGEYMGLYSTGDANTLENVDWSELDIRTDNFVLDMGHRGAQLLSNLIGPKKIVYQDTETGGIYMERVRTSGDPEYELANLTIEAGQSLSDGALVNRVRAEGAEIAEVIDWSSFREDGNLFFLANATEANDEWETAVEGTFILDDSRASSDAHSFVGAADPRVETNDIIRARTTDGLHTLSVDSISYRMTEAIFDMQIEGRDAS